MPWLPSWSRPYTLPPRLQVRSIKKLKVLGSGFDVISIGRQQYVRSVPGELSLDSNKLLELAQAEGHVSRRGMLQQVSVALGVGAKSWQRP